MKREKICGVYRFVHIPTGKSYVGSAKDLEKRIYWHIKLSQRENPIQFAKVMKRLGRENFAHEILEECTEKSRFRREKFYIAKFNSVYPNGYNIHRDPTKGFQYLMTEEVKKKISDSCKGNKNTLGHKMPEDHKRKISESLRITMARPEVRARMSASKIGNKNCLGHVHNEKSRRLISIRTREGWAKRKEMLAKDKSK